MQTKACRKCGEQKPLSAFSKDASSGDGLQRKCKACNDAYRRANLEKIKARQAQWYSDNRGKLIAKQSIRRAIDPEYMASWRASNTERLIEYRSAYRSANKERLSEYQKQYTKDHREAFTARASKRRAAKIRAATGWDDELDSLVLIEAAHLARIRSETLAVEHHVDHVVPLRSAKVCGLHNAYNLAVIPAVENMSKGNRWWPDMP